MGCTVFDDPDIRVSDQFQRFLHCSRRQAQDGHVRGVEQVGFPVYRSPPLILAIPASPFSVTVTGGATTALGNVTWTPTRVAPTVFEIGYPDRTARKFRHGEDYWVGDIGPSVMREREALQEMDYRGWLTVDRTQGDDRAGDAGRTVQFLKSVYRG